MTRRAETGGQGARRAPPASSPGSVGRPPPDSTRPAQPARPNEEDAALLLAGDAPAARPAYNTMPNTPRHISSSVDSPRYTSEGASRPASSRAVRTPGLATVLS